MTNDECIAATVLARGVADNDVPAGAYVLVYIAPDGTLDVSASIGDRKPRPELITSILISAAIHVSDCPEPELAARVGKVKQ